MNGDVWQQLTVVAVFVLLLAVAALIQRRRRRQVFDLDEMEGHEFEVYCSHLLENRGFDEVEVTRGSGDFGADILAQRDGVTYAIQCKRYDGPVGVKAVQEAYAGRDYYDKMVGAVLTNQYFTRPAMEAAAKLKILLWDREYLLAMIEEENANAEGRHKN